MTVTHCERCNIVIVFIGLLILMLIAGIYGYSLGYDVGYDRAFNFYLHGA